MSPLSADRNPRHQDGEKVQVSDAKDIALEPTATGGDKSVALGEIVVEDHFLPLAGVEPYDGSNILTFRALATGVLLGSIISCANIYLGLKSGFGADATMFSSIFGFAILKSLEKSKMPFLSGHFGPHENNIVQATALGCMGVAFIFITGVPALMQMGLLGDKDKVNYGTYVAMAAMCGFWGLGFAVPLRKIFILKLGREMNLNFPLGTASAVTIRSLHNQTSDQASDGSIKAVAISLATSLVWAVCTSYAPGILYSWNVFWWIYKWGGHGIISAVSWGWLSWQWSPSFLGIGMFIGLNPALSFLLGSILAWGIIGPILVATGTSSPGVPLSPNYPGLVTYNSFDPTKFVDEPSPRYWILWPAVFLMLSVSLTTILLEAKSLGRLFKSCSLMAVRKVKRSANRRGDSSEHGSVADDGTVDPIPPQYRVRWWEWSAMAAASFVASWIMMKFLFGITAEMGLLHLAMGLLWAPVVIQVFASTGITPIATVAKGAQFISGGILRHQVDTIGFNSAAVSNLLGATVTSGATQQAAELVQDFRTGFLLRTPMRAQWYAQVCGTVSAIFFLPGLYTLFTTAWPCMLDPASTTCVFAMPATTAWRVITVSILSPRFPLGRSSWITCIVFSIVGICTSVLQNWISKNPKHAHLHSYIPNLSVVALAMTLPGSAITMTVAIGAMAASLWSRFGSASHAKYMYSVAAGAVAGEGIAYVVLGILQIAEVGGPTFYGTKIGCVAEMMC